MTSLSFLEEVGKDLNVKFGDRFMGFSIIPVRDVVVSPVDSEEIKV